ncbi:hypothetical protein Cni_G02794 [Canna indica]|uniref:Uncharacterized protein n=1 Tax=Canna indica TaxID=4628 RepID=A0AAQ3JQL7_9LILI|nr:hypothetical protein Cni_G02794 [Canna indica]
MCKLTVLKWEENSQSGAFGAGVVAARSFWSRSRRFEQSGAFRAGVGLWGCRSSWFPGSRGCSLVSRESRVEKELQASRESCRRARVDGRAGADFRGAEGLLSRQRADKAYDASEQLYSHPSSDFIRHFDVFWLFNTPHRLPYN